MYKFKEIQTVPPAESFIDIVLSKTQRKTPTVVHPGYKITRIRKFYDRKIKFAQTTFTEKMTLMLTEFPRLDDIHPFYADLCNVLYDRDHYKLALGQISTVKNIIDNCAKDYVRMMKFADSLYRCKMLKRAALGRMCTAVKKLGPTLKYLEEIRQHLGRLPSINPTTRTLILTGFPNVGKSSFMNTVTNANVDVQPYAFTTKSLYLGHMDYLYQKWQVIDTPGILDHALEDRNTIEMTAITALAHIPGTILYFMDLSETCGYNLKQQVELFNSIKPMFRGKPLLVILNKMDLKKIDDLRPDELQMIQDMTKDIDAEGQKIEILPTSCATKNGVDTARTKACELLLSRRVDSKINTAKVEGIKNRIQVVQPKTKEVMNTRPPCIPESILKRRAGTVTEEPEKIKTEKDLQEEMGGAGVYSVDLNKSYILANPVWKYDAAPELFDGMNVADFIDENIMDKLAKLEEEERQELLAEGLTDTDAVLKSWKETEVEIEKMHTAIRTQQLANRDKKAGNKVGQTGLLAKRKVKSLAEITAALKSKALSDDFNEETLRGRSKARKRLRDSSEVSAKRNGDDMDTEEGGRSKSKKSLSMSRARSASRVASEKVRGLSIATDRGQSSVARSLGRPELQEKAEKKKRKLTKQRNIEARKGEGDRHIPDFKPKHLFSGKRKAGKTDRR